MTISSFRTQIKVSLQAIGLFIFLTVFGIFAHASSGNHDPRLSSADLEGAPKSGLAGATFAPVTGVKLTHAKVVWRLKSAFAMPAEKIDQALLDCCAFIKPAENIKGEPALDRSVQKQMFADGYGGPGLNGNWGGGRSPVNGKLQVKGMGRTEFVNMRDRDEIHSSGFYSYTEAMIEAVWSTIANREAPWGANRVVALIDTGIMYTQDGRYYQPAVLLIREDVLRPAHFIDNPNIDEKDAFRRERDWRRVTENQSRLPQLLPKSRFGKERTLANGLKEFAARIAEQDAFLYANRIQHGAASPSNSDLSGRLLDLSTMTSLPGWNKLYAADPLPFGDTSLAPTYVLKPFINSLRISEEERTRLLAQTTEVYGHAYNDQLRYEFLRVVGLSEGEARRLRDAPETTAFVKALRKAIDTVYKVPEDTFWVSKEKDPIDLPELLTELARTPLAGVKELSAKLNQLPRTQAQAIAQTLNQIYVNAIFSGLDTPETIAMAARERNQKHPSLYRNMAEWNSRDKLVEAFRESGDSSILTTFIDDLIKSDVGTSRVTDTLVALKSKQSDRSSKLMDSRVIHAKNFSHTAFMRCEEVFRAN